MARARTQYRCSACDRIEPKWLGMCPGCGAWNTLTEENGGRAAAKGPPSDPALIPIPADSIQAPTLARATTGVTEIDRVLGGGLTPGSVVLLGGEPGIGKSTLLLQICQGIARHGRPALYVSGEESAGQVRERALRLGLDLSGLHLLACTDCQAALSAMDSERFSLAVIDSIQTMRCEELNSAPGSVSQVREAASRLAEAAKKGGLPVFLIGHVTKEGTLAGPRTLEHLVDTVLYFEADPGRALRVVRAHKNRFGPVSEIGVFEMSGRGLIPVDNPSAAFLADRPKGAAGSVVLCMLRGSRPVLVEVQALASPTVNAQPRRTAWGCDPNRVALLAAVLERRAGAQLAGCDLFINVAGGLSLDEPAADLAICLAVLSSLYDKAVPEQLAVFGEVGLAGEIRAVPAAQARAAEAASLGFVSLLCPTGNVEQVKKVTELTSLSLSRVDQLAQLTLESGP